MRTLISSLFISFISMVAFAQTPAFPGAEGAGMFTTGGHIMLARGVNNDGNILVADPNSEKFTTRESGFTDNEIEKGLKSAWKIERAK